MIPAPDNVMNMDINQEDEEDIIPLNEIEIIQQIEQQQQIMANDADNHIEDDVVDPDPDPNPNPDPNPAEQQPEPEPEHQSDDGDDDEVMNDVNRLLPANAIERDGSVMGIQQDQDEVTRFCIKYNIAQHLPIFREEEFDLVSTLVKLGKEELMEMGLKRGQAMKCVDIFQNHSDAAPQANDTQFTFGNIHVQRRKAKQSANSRIMSVDDAPVEEKVNGDHRIKTVGPKPTIAVQIKLRDLVIDLILIESIDTDAKKIRKLICGRTKNGEISTARYWYDQEKKIWPNSPVHLLYAASQQLKSLGIINVEAESFKEKGHGGRPSYHGTITRVKLSDAWNAGDSSKREDLVKFKREHKGVRWLEYAHLSGDYLNCMALGLFGLRQPNYALTLQEAIANQSE